MGVSVGHLYKKKLVRNLRGEIVDWFDEASGGWIVQKGNIVNPTKWEEYQKKLEDEKEAAKAISKAKVDPNAPDRTNAPSQNKKVEELEKKVNDMDNKLDAILNALKK